MTFTNAAVTTATDGCRPWYVRDNTEARYFSGCPYCDRPVRLIGIRPAPERKFVPFDPHNQRPCPYRLKARRIERARMTDATAKGTDITALLLFQHDERSFWVSPGTLVQCLQIAAHEGRVPPLDPDWMRCAIPDGYRVPPRDPDEPLPKKHA